jgi:hypothetical protein
MTESPIVNEWIEQSSKESTLDGVRETLVKQLRKRFPGQVTEEIVQTINSQPSRAMLDDWAEQIVVVETIDDFRTHLRR